MQNHGLEILQRPVASKLKRCVDHLHKLQRSPLVAEPIRLGASLAFIAIQFCLRHSPAGMLTGPTAVNNRASCKPMHDIATLPEHTFAGMEKGKRSKVRRALARVFANQLDRFDRSGIDHCVVISERSRDHTQIGCEMLGACDVVEAILNGELIDDQANLWRQPHEWEGSLHVNPDVGHDVGHSGRASFRVVFVAKRVLTRAQPLCWYDGYTRVAFATEGKTLVLGNKRPSNERQWCFLALGDDLTVTCLS